MQYFEWIEKYKKGTMSAADRLAFEHEAQENEQLSVELEAVDLTEALLAEVAALPDVPPSTKMTGREKFRKIYVITIGLILVAVAIFAWQYRSPNKEQLKETIIPIPALPEPEGSENIPEIIAPKEIENENIKRPVAANTAPEPPVKKKSQSASRPTYVSQQKTLLLAEATLPDAPKKIHDPEPEETPISPSQEKIAVYTVSAVIDTVLAQSSDIALTATEKIVLKPGFHAKAGTTFKAKVSNGPLFEKKGSPN